jgi:hypothetical protein
MLGEHPMAARAMTTVKLASNVLSLVMVELAVTQRVERNATRSLIWSDDSWDVLPC